MRHLIFISFLFIGFSLNAQTSTEKDTLAKYTYDELSNKFYAAKRDSLKAIFYAKYAIKKAKTENDTIELGSAYYKLSDITKDSIHFVDYWNGVIKKTKNHNNKLYPAFSYLQLGDYFFHKGKKEIALKKYLLMQKTLEISGNDYLKSINHIRLGMSKMKNGEIKNALKLFKESNKYFSQKKITESNLDDYFSLLMNMSNTYKSLRLYDSAIFYNEKMKLLALKHKQSILYGYTLYSFGSLELKKGNYRLAIDSISKAIPFIVKDENYFTLSIIYKSLGDAYNKLGNIRSSLKFYKKTDSLFQENGNYYKSQKPAYHFLVNYYKENKNYNKQLEYINKYIKVDSVLNASAIIIRKSLTKNYDIPNLLAEKKRIENRLKGDLSTTKNWVFGTGALAFLLSFFLIHQTRKRKAYKKNFKKLMNTSVQKTITKEKTIPKKENTIPKETVQNILSLLEHFETNHSYISSEVTLSSLAKTFETNSKYLSQLINQYKGKSFNNYVNELRINYAIAKLKTDLTFRKYSIKAIAFEVGFNTTESFSKAFFKNTGLRPSFFIKELEKK